MDKIVIIKIKEIRTLVQEKVKCSIPDAQTISFSIKEKNIWIKKSGSQK